MKTTSILPLFFIASLALADADHAQTQAGRKITTDELYGQLNMRTFFSSYGQRLKYYCESYPREFFERADDNQITGIRLEDGDDVWTISIVGDNRIEVANRIRAGTFNTTNVHDVYYDEAGNDWRARETFIEVPDDCVHFVPGVTDS